MVEFIQVSLVVSEGIPDINEMTRSWQGAGVSSSSIWVDSNCRVLFGEKVSWGRSSIVTLC